MQTKQAQKWAFIRKSEVLRRLGGLGDSALRELIAAGKISAGVPITPGGRALGWLECEIDDYGKSRLALRDAPGDEPKPPVPPPFPTRKQRDDLQPPSE